MRNIELADLEDIALGAAVLGAGGGGDPYVGKLMAQAALRAGGPVALIGADEVGDEDLVVPVAMMGAPTVMVEKLPSGFEVMQAFGALQAYLGRSVRAVMSMEIGGLNSTIPIAVAAHEGLPLVDADGMGRAFPELQMVTPTLHGVKATPMAICDEKGNAALLETIDNHWTERLARSMTVDMGGAAMIALYPMLGKQLRPSVVRGSISLAQQVGRAIRSARVERRDPVAGLLGACPGALLFEGKIQDVSRQTDGAFVRGRVRLEGIHASRGRDFQIEFQNENLVALCGGEPVACVPDLISTLDLETAEPITTERLRYGLRVAVVGLPADPQWTSPAGLELVGPERFGYRFPYRPVRELLPASGRA
jgi:DUF917 family protein